MRTWHIVGDVHGHVEQLRALLRALGWQADPHDPFEWTPPDGAMLISVGDVVDRGPDSLACLMTLKRLQAKGHAEMVLGNHECRYRDLLDDVLSGRGPARIPESRLIAWLQLLGLPASQHHALAAWLDARPAWLALPEAVVAHAAWTNAVRGQSRRAQVEYCAFGRSAASIRREGARALPEHGRGLVEIDARSALPTRVGWAARWRGPATLFWGHQTVVQGAVSRIGRTINLESGCFLGHALSAYVHPTGEVVQAALAGVPGTLPVGAGGSLSHEPR